MCSLRRPLKHTSTPSPFPSPNSPPACVACDRAGTAATFRLVTLEGDAVPRQAVRKGQVLVEGPRLPVDGGGSGGGPPLDRSGSGSASSAVASGAAGGRRVGKRRAGGDPAAGSSVVAEGSAGSSTGRPAGRSLAAEKSTASTNSSTSGGTAGLGGVAGMGTLGHHRLVSAMAFDADVVFCKPSHCSFRIGHMLVVHCATIRQAARVTALTPIPANPTFGPMPMVRTGTALAPTASASSALSDGGLAAGAAGSDAGASPAIALSWTSGTVPAAPHGPTHVTLASGGDVTGAMESPAPLSPTASPLAVSYHESMRVSLRFAHHAEFLLPGATVILRDGHTIAAGCVAAVAESETRSLSAPAMARRPHHKSMLAAALPAPMTHGDGAGAAATAARRAQARGTDDGVGGGGGGVGGGGGGGGGGGADPSTPGGLASRVRSHTVHFADAGVGAVQHNDLDAPAYGSSGTLTAAAAHAAAAAAGDSAAMRLPAIAFAPSSQKGVAKRRADRAARDRAGRGGGVGAAAPRSAGAGEGGASGSVGSSGSGSDSDGGGLLAALSAAGGRF
jgi:hypothetical protein